ncbi:MAG: FHA domain-containing protein [Vicinamibacteria bacterium]
MNVLRLRPDNGDPIITIEHAIVRVGRDPSSDIHLRDASVSRQHAEITNRGEEWVIVDQDSGNGIHVDGRRTQQAVLLPGQRLQIGNLRFRVEIDRGDDGATVMLGRSPLLDNPSDRTLMGSAPPRFPPPLPENIGPGSGKKKWAVVTVAFVAALLLLTFAAVKYLSDRRLKEAAAKAAAVVPPPPTPRPTPTPESTPTPTPVPTRRPTGSLLVTTDVAAWVSIDGRTVAQLKAADLRRFEIAPGEHIVRFQIGDTKTESVVRVRVNEQTVVKHQSEVPSAPLVTPSPQPSASR